MFNPSQRLLPWLIRSFFIGLFLLCVAAAALWVRSFWYVDEAIFHAARSPWGYYFCSYPGQLFIQVWRDDDARHEATISGGETWPLGPNNFPVAVAETVHPGGPTLLGFACYWDSEPESTLRPLSIKIPYWIVPPLFAVVPAFWAAKALRRRIADSGRRAGKCLTCGYDLRASPQRCPECGTPIPASKEANP